MEGCIAAMEAADFPYVSCNFYSEADGIRSENVLDSYEVFELGGVSVAIIGITTGLDVFIDGHSHTTLPMEEVTDEEGNTVILTQTDSYLDAVGQLTIAADGTITTELLTAEDLSGLTPDPEVKALEDAWISEINAQLGQVIGYAEVTLDNYDTEGNRLVRKQ